MRALGATAGTVTSAAAVMIAVFSIFATLRLLEFKQLGFGLAVAILLDATIVRAVALPAVVTLLGRRSARRRRVVRARDGALGAAMMWPWESPVMASPQSQVARRTGSTLLAGELTLSVVCCLAVTIIWAATGGPFWPVWVWTSLAPADRAAGGVAAGLGPAAGAAPPAGDPGIDLRRPGRLLA